MINTKREKMRSSRLGMISSSLVAILVVATPCLAQEKASAKISGRIVDDSTNVPIANANVFIANSMMGTSSDTSGYFEMKRVPAGFHELVVSCIGYFMSSTKIQLLDSSDQMVEMRLRPKLLNLGVVEVTAPNPVAWKEDLETFKKLLLGETPEASQCQIKNPEILDFSTDGSGTFQAWAGQLLTIDNLALGYRLHLSLATFHSTMGRLSVAWKVRYEELLPSSAGQQSDWDSNREDAHLGSLRHFLLALTKGELADEGFVMFKLPRVQMIRKDVWIYERKGRDIARQTSANEWVIRFDGRLTVMYDRELRPRTSTLALAKDSLRIDSRGQILDQLALRVSGEWGKEGLARQLPMEFRPRSKK